MRPDDAAHDRLELALFRITAHIRNDAENDAARRACDRIDAQRAARSFFARPEGHRLETMRTLSLEDFHVCYVHYVEAGPSWLV